MNSTKLRRFGIYTSIAIAASAATFLAVRARAAGIPDPASALIYTGYLEDAAGAPLTGKHAIAVNFWSDQMMSAMALCTGKLATAELQAGRFQVPLPKACADTVDANPNLWVNVEVDGSSLGATALGAVPYALQAGHAAAADGALDGRIAAIETKLGTLASKDLVPIISEWQSYAPVLSTNTGAAVQHQATTGVYRRVGDSIEVSLWTHFSDAPGSGAVWYQWSLPDKLTMDLTKFPGGTGTGAIGSGFANNSPANNAALVVEWRTAKTVQASANGASTWYVNDSAPFPWDSTDSDIVLRFSVPIVGWTATK